MNEPSKIYYTVDGSTPTQASRLWEAQGPRRPGEVLRFEETTTIKWIAEDIKGHVSNVRSRTFHIGAGVDACPIEDARRKVHVRNVNSQVNNYQAWFGCTINDLIREEDFPTKSGQKQHVNEVTDELLAAGIITEDEYNAIRRAADRAKAG